MHRNVSFFKEIPATKVWAIYVTKPNQFLRTVEVEGNELHLHQEEETDRRNGNQNRGSKQKRHNKTPEQRGVQRFLRCNRETKLAVRTNKTRSQLQQLEHVNEEQRGNSAGC